MNSENTKSSFYILAIAISFYLLALVAFLPAKLDHDVGLFLSAGRLLNQGAELYVDYIDFNLPPIIFLGRLSGLLSESTGIPLDYAHKILILSILLGAVLLSVFTFRAGTAVTSLALATMTVGLSVAVFFATPELGRREHLLLACCLPWLLTIARDRSKDPIPPRIQILSGLFAGIAILLKPHFVLVAVAIGLVDVFRARMRFRKISIATYTAAIVSLGLLALWWVVYPHYFQEVIPFSLATFGRYSLDPGTSLRNLVMSTSWIPLVLLLAAGLSVDRSARTHQNVLPALAGFAGFGLAVVAIIGMQGLSWHYHRLPIEMAGQILAVILFVYAIQTRRRPATLALAALCVLLFAKDTTSFAKYYQSWPSRQSVVDHPLSEMIRDDFSNSPILIISSSVLPASDLLPMVDVTWSGPLITHFPLAALIAQDGRYGIEPPIPEPQRTELAQWYITKLTQSMAANPPDMVMINVSPGMTFFQNDGFDVLRWLREYPGFDAIWSSYGYTADGPPVDYGFRAMQVYRR